MLVVLFMFLSLDIRTELRGKVQSTAKDMRTPQGCLLVIFIKVIRFYFVAVEMIMESWQEMV